MNISFAAAGCLAILGGLIHSVLGELLLIRRLTNEGLPSLAPFSLVEVRKWGLVGTPDFARRTLRFSWHLPSVLGAAIGAILLRLSWPASPEDLLAFIQRTATLSFFACSLIVFIVSRGQHLGWVLFLLVAVLIWLGSL
jgi:hypothetical protein